MKEWTSKTLVQALDAWTVGCYTFAGLPPVLYVAALWTTI